VLAGETIEISANACFQPQYAEQGTDPSFWIQTNDTDIVIRANFFDEVTKKKEVKCASV
jgi:hypothetical protein